MVFAAPPPGLSTFLDPPSDLIVQMRNVEANSKAYVDITALGHTE